MKRKTAGMLGLARRSGTLAYGFEQVRERILRGDVLLVILAEDASERTTKKMVQLCEETETQWIVTGTKETLSHAIGLVNKAVLGLTDPNMAKQVKAYHSESEE